MGNNRLACAASMPYIPIIHCRYTGLQQSPGVHIMRICASTTASAKDDSERRVRFVAAMIEKERAIEQAWH